MVMSFQPISKETNVEIAFQIGVIKLQNPPSIQFWNAVGSAVRTYRQTIVRLHAVSDDSRCMDACGANRVCGLHRPETIAILANSALLVYSHRDLSIFPDGGCFLMESISRRQLGVDWTDRLEWPNSMILSSQSKKLTSPIFSRRIDLHCIIRPRRPIGYIFLDVYIPLVPYTVLRMLPLFRSSRCGCLRLPDLPIDISFPFYEFYMYMF